MTTMTTIGTSAPTGLISRVRSGLRKRLSAFLARAPQGRVQLCESLEARQMLAAGPVVPDGVEFRVSTNKVASETPDIGATSTGTYVSIWTDPDDKSGTGIAGQLLGVDGSKTGSQFAINTFTTGNQSNAKLAILDSGAFVVTWTSVGADGDGNAVRAQLFDAAGTKVGTEFTVNTTTTGDQNSASVASASDGSFVVTWQGPDGDSTGIFGQRFDSAGAKVDGEFSVNTGTLGAQTASDVAVNGDGSFVVTWLDSPGGGQSILGQQYDSKGGAVGGNFTVYESTLDDLSLNTPLLSNAPDGSFVVAWANVDAGNTKNIYAQIFDASANPQGSKIAVDAPLGDNTIALTSLAVGTNGGFVINWQQSGGALDGSAVIAQYFNPYGVARGDNFIVNTTTASNQFLATVTAGANNTYAAVWIDTSVATKVSGQLFKFDSTTPAFVSFEPVASPVAAPVGSVDLYFSEAIEVESFTWESVTLTYNGGSNIIDEITGAGLTFTLVDAGTNRYQIGGLATLNTAAGEYTLTLVDGGVSNPDGVVIGVGGEVSWVVGVAAPSTPELSVASEGVPGTGYTKQTTPTVVGTATAGSTVEIYEGNTLLGSGTADENGDYSIELSTLADGPHDIFAVAIIGDYTSDPSAAGTIHVDTTTVTMTLITWPSNPTDYGPLRFAVQFSAPVAISTLTWEDLVLTRDGGANLITSGAGIEVIGYDQNLLTNTYIIKIAPGLRNTPGTYQLTINGPTITNNAGTPVPNSISKSYVVATRPVRITWPTALDPTYGPVRFAVTFTSLVNLATFTWADLELTLDGGTNLITSGDGIQISEYALTPNTYLIKINSAMRTAPGNYQLTVKGAGITGAAARPVSGDTSKGWVVAAVE